MIINFKGATFVAKLFLAETGHEIATIFALNNSGAPRANFKTLFYNQSLSELVKDNVLIFFTGFIRMRNCHAN